MRFPDTLLVAAVQIMICAIMMDSITAEVPQVVNIPCQIIHLGFQTVFDIAAFDFSIARKTPIPTAQIRYHQMGVSS